MYVLFNFFFILPYNNLFTAYLRNNDEKMTRWTDDDSDDDDYTTGARDVSSPRYLYVFFFFFLFHFTLLISIYKVNYETTTENKQTKTVETDITQGLDVSSP
jgi:hypothetical protein